MVDLRNGRPPEWQTQIVSLDEVFMHYFEKMSSASVGFGPRLTTALALDPAGGPPSFRPLTAHPWKKSCRRRCSQHKSVGLV